jgi:protein-disulfide isomerase
MTQASDARLSVPVGERDHIRGPTTAPITLVEYGDYQCPHCATAHPIIIELGRRLGDRLRVVFRNFPRPERHPHAEHAAEAAGAQGKFWQMHDLLFEHFKHQPALEEANLVGFAAELGLDLERFERELAEHVHAARVREDVDGGLRSGVNRTPTFFINGVWHGGFFSLPALLAAIDEAAAEGVTSAERPATSGAGTSPDVAADEVAQASWESFPASDAPGWR